METQLTPAQMTVQILNGGTNMPGFSRNLSPDELDELIAFLRSRKSPSPPVADRGTSR
ncbi:MAG: cytochrome c [Chloroflexi bacterium]|nr:cytochrome c [Chloroflexota bacterium]